MKAHPSNVSHFLTGKIIDLFQFPTLIIVFLVYSSQASTFNCEMSDLDQSELKNGIHFAHTVDRDFWLFSWVLDNTCRDKITTLGGSRTNSERRMDIFREPGKNLSSTSPISSQIKSNKHKIITSSR